MTMVPESPSASGAPTTLVLLVQDRHGSVERVLGVARRQGCTLVNLALEPAEQAGLARVSLTIAGGQPVRLAQQLARLVDVVDIRGAGSPTPADSPAYAEIARTPFHAQADGVSPRDGDPVSPDTLTED